VQLLKKKYTKEKKMNSPQPTTEVKEIILFNHYHYGDTFSTRGLVKDLRRFFPYAKFSYAFGKNRYVVHDLVDYELENEFNDQTLQNLEIYTNSYYDITNYRLYINTWVGCAYHSFPPTHNHPNFIEHIRIYDIIYQRLNETHGFNLSTIQDDIWYYVPEIDYSKFNTGPADDIVQHTKNRVLICNNEAMSAQSSVGDLRNVIVTLATSFPQHTFFVTYRIPTNLSNIIFTNDIFQQDNDLCEISYLSQFCDVIIGKNSGAHAHTWTKTNLLDASKTNICLSHANIDCMPYGLDYRFNHVFSNNTDDQSIINLIASYLTS